MREDDFMCRRFKGCCRDHLKLSYRSPQPSVPTWEVGLLDELRSQMKLDIPRFAATQHHLGNRSIKGLATAPAVVDGVKRDQDMVTADRLLECAYKTKSLFSAGSPAD